MQDIDNLNDDCISRKAVLELAQIIVTDDYSGNKVFYAIDVEDVRQLPSARPQELKKEWIDKLIVKVLADVDGGTGDTYIRYNDICDRVEESIREYCGCKTEGEE